MTTPNPVHDLLRKNIMDIHEQLEALPYAKALENGTLPLESYVGHLRCMAVLHSELERHLAHPKPPLDQVWREDMSRLPLLLADLEFFRPRFLRDVLPALRLALGLAADIRRRCKSDPATLLGILYVLEGSAKGGLTLAPMARDAFNLPDTSGTAYLGSWGIQVPSRFESSMERMQGALGDNPDLPRVLDAAREFILSLKGVFTALHPVADHDLGYHVAGVNPEGGEHDMPTDPVELAAAVRAGERCLEEYPYFERRYGERGRRFTSSDSGWLVTLSRMEQDAADAQVLWLCSVLASRGMPRVLMEKHLRHLAAELSAARPEHERFYVRLASAADMLERMRLDKIPADRAASLAQEFHASAGAAFVQAALPETAELVLSAAADEAQGVENGVASLMGWLADPGRFPPAWVEAVQELLAKARTEVSG